MANVRWSVIIPTIRPNSFADFIRNWDELFTKHQVHLWVMQDLEQPNKEIEDLCQNRKYEITTLSWKDIKAEYIPGPKTDMVRSWAFLQAYKHDSSLYMMTLDDDVQPVGDPFAEYEEVFRQGSVSSKFLDVGALTSSGLQMRGFPYKDRKRADVAVQYGGWSGVLDYDAATQLSVPKEYKYFFDIVMPVPKGTAATCCIMNAAWRRDYTPIMWQLPMLEGRYNRVGDIWSGLLIKKVLDCIGAVMVINGRAKVLHQRASDPYNSLIKEAPSVKLNDELWDNLTDPQSPDLFTAYEQVTEAAIKFFAQSDPAYADHFRKARNEWLNFFK